MPKILAGLIKLSLCEFQITIVLKYAAVFLYTELFSLNWDWLFGKYPAIYI
jgi:hypothetical protein